MDVQSYCKCQSIQILIIRCCCCAAVVPYHCTPNTCSTVRSAVRDWSHPITSLHIDRSVCALSSSTVSVAHSYLELLASVIGCCWCCIVHGCYIDSLSEIEPSSEINKPSIETVYCTFLLILHSIILLDQLLRQICPNAPRWLWVSSSRRSSKSRASSSHDHI